MSITFGLWAYKALITHLVATSVACDTFGLPLHVGPDVCRFHVTVIVGAVVDLVKVHRTTPKLEVLHERATSKVTLWVFNDKLHATFTVKVPREENALDPFHKTIGLDCTLAQVSGRLDGWPVGVMHVAIRGVVKLVHCVHNAIS